MPSDCLPSECGQGFVVKVRHRFRRRRPRCVERYDPSARFIERNTGSFQLHQSGHDRQIGQRFEVARVLRLSDRRGQSGEPGQGKELIRNKETYAEGSIPVNVDGGLLSKGHPIGATGGSQIRTVVLQLRGEAGDMQVKNPKYGLVHNIGGVGLYGNVTIMGV